VIHVIAHTALAEMTVPDATLIQMVTISDGVAATVAATITTDGETALMDAQEQKVKILK